MSDDAIDTPRQGARQGRWTAVCVGARTSDGLAPRFRGQDRTPFRSRLLHVLDTQLGKTQYIAGEECSIADIAIWPWYGAIMSGAYSASEFLSTQEYRHVRRWMDLVGNRPAVQRGRRVNSSSVARNCASQSGIAPPILALQTRHWARSRPADSDSEPFTVHIRQSRGDCSMLHLYYHPRSTFSRRVRVALLEKQIEHEATVVDLAAGEHRKPAFLALNPY